MIREILLLGNEKLYEKSAPVEPGDLPQIREAAPDLHDTLMDFRARYGAGRAIAAPQIGLMKRLIYMHTGEPVALINPSLEFIGDKTMLVLDDCMSFPGLYVRVLRHEKCIIRYRDLEWTEREMTLQGDLAELLQHEYDHLDGILATMRATDNRAFVMRQN